ncbi:hypothetical protein GCM10016234_34370 [Tianweitania populi]|uniref:Uncharacterized protein n=1 Tax=Tianweitania populi TaxID=1607949 RepID=A0A8J3DSS7_9HYPH|nr:hypothetical protein GCM10016234_34370 [Tianweitania populi]
MSFEITHLNSGGDRESQSVRQADALPLLSKIERLGGTNIQVRSANGQRWTAAQARAQLI